MWRTDGLVSVGMVEGVALCIELWYDPRMSITKNTPKSINISAKSLLAKGMATENSRVTHDEDAETAAFDVKNRELVWLVWKDMSNSMYDMLVAHEISLDAFSLCGMSIQPVRQDHGVSGESLGFIFEGRFAYSPDVAYMNDAELGRLSGTNLWIVDYLPVSES